MTALLVILNGIILVILAALFVWLKQRNVSGESLRGEIAENRKELSSSLKDFGDTLQKQVLGLTQLNESKLNDIRKTVEDRLVDIRKDNDQKLEKIRQTVDDKLQDTLEKRLGDSFRLVSERLEQVQRGLGEMQNLASGVGDLKKVLSNVKTRGTLGEIQLGNILAEILAPEQYGTNVCTKHGGRENVEFAVKMPGKNEQTVWLPIDSKFPMEDYQKLLDAQERGDAAAVEESGKELEARIKKQARDIRDKYLDPPHTTEFGILFLPIEGLFAEVLRRPGLYELLQRDYKITITGPTTMAAFLNSLQMGFRTLAVEKRAHEVWNLLGMIKTEFEKFGTVLARTQKQLMTATRSIEDAAKKSRTIERKLRDVQALPAAENSGLLEPDTEDSEAVEETAGEDRDLL